MTSGRVFYGAAIQGNKDRDERAAINARFIQAIKEEGFDVATEHTTSTNYGEAARLLEGSIGPLPPKGRQRTIYVRDKMIGAVESDLAAAIFELSVPSIGTGIEFAHAYLRPKTGHPEIPILVLYEKDYWPQGLSSMVKGAAWGEAENIMISEYGSVDDGRAKIKDFLESIEK
ncbi:hypothetical protein ACFLRF_04505 [Candidatus Altiarchaeota archaeon]